MLIPHEGVSTPLVKKVQQDPEPRETSGSPGESLGSLPTARTEPGETEETPGMSFDSSREGKAKDPVGDLGESFGLLSVGRGESDSTSSRTRTNTGKTAGINTNSAEERTPNLKHYRHQLPVTRSTEKGRDNARGGP